MKHAELGGIGEGMLREPLRNSVGVVSTLDGDEHPLNFASRSSDDQDRTGGVHEHTMGHTPEDHFG